MEERLVLSSYNGTLGSNERSELLIHPAVHYRTTWKRQNYRDCVCLGWGVGVLGPKGVLGGEGPVLCSDYGGCYTAVSIC